MKPVVGTVVGVVAFGSELALLAAAALLGWVLGQGVGNTVVGVIAAIALPLATATAWGRWLAPRARHRLPQTPRLVAKCALFAVVGAVVAASVSPVWGAVLVVCGVGSVLAGHAFPFPGTDPSLGTD